MESCILDWQPMQGTSVINMLLHGPYELMEFWPKVVRLYVHVLRHVGTMRQLHRIMWVNGLDFQWLEATIRPLWGIHLFIWSYSREWVFHMMLHAMGNAYGCDCQINDRNELDRIMFNRSLTKDVAYIGYPSYNPYDMCMALRGPSICAICAMRSVMWA